MIHILPSKNTQAELNLGSAAAFWETSVQFAPSSVDVSTVATLLPEAYPYTLKSSPLVSFMIRQANSLSTPVLPWSTLVLVPR